MKLAIIGTGYVGLITGACFAEFGYQTVCIDKDQSRIKELNNSKCPFYEPGVDTLLDKHLNKTKLLSFSNSLSKSINDADIIFITVGTPSKRIEGEADLSYVWNVAEEISNNISKYCIVVTKSTVPVGTTKEVKSIIAKKINEKDFDVVSNPEFLREGSAINDFMRPDRVVIGCENKKSEDIMKELYRPLYLLETPIVSTTVESSEIIKYASNSFLATKISFINQVADLCEKVGADVQDVAKGMGIDKRIGNKFLHAGPGYGGSCFPKDVKGLVALFSQNGIESEMGKAVHSINEKQKKIIVNKLEKFYENQDLDDKNISILGLSFKPETDDLREAPSLSIYESLKNKVNTIKAYDPLAKNNIEYFRSINLDIKEDVYSCCDGSDAIIICTEWKEFRSMDLIRLSKIVNKKVIFDGRNLFDPIKLEELGWEYISVGRKYHYG